MKIANNSILCALFLMYSTNIVLAMKQETKKVTIEELNKATQQLSNAKACTNAYNAYIKYKPYIPDIETNHLNTSKVKRKGYFNADSKEKVAELLSKSGCVPDKMNYIKETGVVECHLNCNQDIGYDVTLTNKSILTKNFLLIYTANKEKLWQTFIVNLYPRNSY